MATSNTEGGGPALLASGHKKDRLNNFFLILFLLLWFLGPVTQLIQIINLPFHVKIGFSEHNILEPEMGWFRADELAIAWADMTCLVTGAVFMVGACVHVHHLVLHYALGLLSLATLG